MVGGGAVGRYGGRGAAALLVALAVSGGCSFGAARDDASPATAAPSVGVPPPPVPSVAAVRAAQTATRIEKVTIESAPPTSRVVLTLDGSAEPEVSLLVNQRLVIDVPDTTCATLPRVIEAPGDPLVERVRTGQHAAPDSKSRVVIDLRHRADFSVRAQGDRIIAYLTPASGATSDGDGSRILFGAEAGAGGSAVPATASLPATEPVPTPQLVPAPVPTPQLVPAPVPTPQLVPTPEPAAAPTLEPAPLATPSPEPFAREPEPFVVEAEAERATPVAAEATPQPYDGEATTGAASDATSAAPTSVPAATPEPLATIVPQVEATRPGGKRISIDFTEADVRTVIELIASAGGYTVLFTPEVGGTISISLIDRPWEDALTTVLRAKHLREVRHEDVMLVSPAGR